jgi:hypothetical protein
MAQYAFYPPSASGTISGSVTVSNFPASQTVNGTVTANQGGAPWTANIVQGGNTAAVSAASALKVDGSAVTQPVSGTVTATGTVTGNQGTANTIANAWPVKVTDGTNTGAVTAGGALKVDASATTQPVSGTVTANQGGAPWTANIIQGGNTAAVSAAGALKVDGSAVTQPVSGAISAKTPTAGTVTQAAVTVGTTAVRLTVSGSAPSATRSVLVATPDSASAALFYIGSSSVTNSGATRGIQIQAGQSFTANSDAGDYWIVSDTASQTCYVMEQA